MTRIVRRPIFVSAWRADIPHYFEEKNSNFRSEHEVDCVLDGWSEMGEWWNGETERQVIRVLTVDNSIFDLEQLDGQWFIYKVWD